MIEANFETGLFIGTLVLYIVLNVINSTLMIKSKRVEFKLLFAALPFAYVIPVMYVSMKILEAVIDFDNVPFGTDYGGYGTGLAVILGLMMMFFYMVNAILLFLALKKNRNLPR